ncbi:MAG TPA: cytochrome c-type biogenesis protein CcmH [Candidatus Binatia bacterium]|jgi:cytochrome c-type biogenesis protein CcmH/NrfF
MRLKPLLGALVLGTVVLFTARPLLHADPPLGQHEIEEGLTCQCGCGLTVAACNHLECSFAVPARKDIADSLARGETGEAILARYKAEYGEKVLSSPVAEGFNRLAWIMPYLAIFVAGSLMMLFLRRRAAEGPPASATPPPSAPTDERLARLQEEVEDLKR